MSAGQISSSHAGSAGVATAVLDVPDAIPEPPSAEPEPRPALEQELKQVWHLLGEHISRVQRQYAQSFLEAQLPTPGKPEPEQEFRTATMSGWLLNHQRLAEAALRAEAEEKWDACLAESAAAQLTPIIDIWEAAQRVRAEEMWRSQIEEEGRRQRERRLRELEGAISNHTPEQVHEPVRPASQNAHPRESAWEREQARQREATAAEVAEDAALAMRVYAREVLDEQAEAASHLAYQRALAEIAGTFQKQPATALLSAPREVLLVPVRIAGHRNMGLAQFQPYEPQPMSSSAQSCDFPATAPPPVKPQSQLQTEKPDQIHEPKRVFPTWVLSAVAAAATILVVLNFSRPSNPPVEVKAPSVRSGISSTGPETKPSPTAPATPANSQTGAPDTTTTAASFLAQEVEVSGLRIGADLLHRSQLQYVVDNHSGVQLTGLVLHIKVTSMAPTSKGTLFQVSAVVPSLGPNESKEIRTDIEGQLQSKPIPDWQYLKTEVQVSGQ